MALVAARAALGASHRDPVLLCSQDAHVSINKAARVMGLADDALRRFPWLRMVAFASRLWPSV
jgi:glutamate/tyrosine decarboxylase-like PLP-dependent enzyme